MASEHPSTLKDSPPDQTDNSRNSRKSEKPASASSSSGDFTDGVGGNLTTHEAESGFESAKKDISTKDSRRDSVADIERKLRYLKFQDYEFDNDDQFQSGWKTLSSVVPSVERDKHYLRAKLFYYSKHIEAVDIEEYMKWKENPLNQTEVKGVATPQVQQLEDKGGNSCSPAANTEDSDKNTVSESGTLTFSEVIDFIQSGKTIPGLKTVDVKPTDADPSPSVMGRKPKPWER
ncbi:uncharacterized protein LOC124142424 isoform X2 [Haliotis rufescens]|uniref:uncharacterized protein LOC124142424 isoform X2 n=1 Tax=Haliotis rufescens TaxID=6454 RepID=UPI00201F4748|nr:uncharacterized protein LOC124142424 isoform X2 [Haliotis rufescens]